MKYTVLLLICYIQSVAQTQIHLWPNGAPGFEARKDEPEQAKDWWVKNIHNPSITVYQPATGTANDWPGKKTRLIYWMYILARMSIGLCV